MSELDTWFAVDECKRGVAERLRRALELLDAPGADAQRIAEARSEMRVAALALVNCGNAVERLAARAMGAVDVAALRSEGGGR